MHFRMVECSGYLQKINDGRFIIHNNVDGSVYADLNSQPDNSFKLDENNSCWMKEIGESCGDLEFIKTYYKFKENHFVGMCVGYKEVEVSAYLYVDWDSSTEQEYVGKQTKDLVRCAVVYFANNRKRYVPLEYLKESEE